MTKFIIFEWFLIIWKKYNDNVIWKCKRSATLTISPLNCQPIIWVFFSYVFCRLAWKLASIKLQSAKNMEHAQFKPFSCHIPPSPTGYVCEYEYQNFIFQAWIATLLNFVRSWVDIKKSFFHLSVKFLKNSAEIGEQFFPTTNIRKQEMFVFHRVVKKIGTKYLLWLWLIRFFFVFATLCKRYIVTFLCTHTLQMLYTLVYTRSTLPQGDCFFYLKYLEKGKIKGEITKLHLT